MTNCKECGKDLGGVTGGVPVTTNAHVRYEHGRTEVSWNEYRNAEEHHPICWECLDRSERDQVESVAARLESQGMPQLASAVRSGKEPVDSYLYDPSEETEPDDPDDWD